jgi:glycosyltransferase involved in cell wall biosynthesis
MVSCSKLALELGMAKYPMETSLPLVSIGLPVYNGAAFLQEALDSLVAQTYPNLEIIISDNGSTDDTEEICRSAAKKDSRVAYHRYSENRGAAWNYNNVFHLSKGKYFKWNAHDDNCHPEFTSECIALMEQKPEIVLCYPQARVIDELGGKVEMEEEELDLFSEQVEKRFLCAGCEIGFRHNPVFGFVRRSILERTALIQPYLASDLALLAELCLYGPFALIKKELFFRRQRPGNIGVRIEDVKFYDPNLRKCAVFSRFNLGYELTKCIWRAQIATATKVKLHGTMLKWTIRHRWMLLRELKEALSSYMEHYLGFGLKDVRQRLFPGSRLKGSSAFADTTSSKAESPGDQTAS